VALNLIDEQRGINTVRMLAKLKLMKSAPENNGEANMDRRESFEEAVARMSNIIGLAKLLVEASNLADFSGRKSQALSMSAVLAAASILEKESIAVSELILMLSPYDDSVEVKNG
jgi:hypothetical protein